MPTHIHSEPCLEGEVRLNDLYQPSTIEDFFRDPFFERLLIKDELSQGKVEVCQGGDWGTVCRGDTWSNEAASVVCHQLGFSRLGTYSLSHSVSVSLSHSHSLSLSLSLTLFLSLSLSLTLPHSLSLSLSLSHTHTLSPSLKFSRS